MTNKRQSRRLMALVVALGMFGVSCGDGTIPSASEPGSTAVSLLPDTTHPPSEPSPDGTDTTEASHPFQCQLPVMLRRNHGAVTGTLTRIEGPFTEDASAGGDPGREFWSLTMEIGQVMEGTFTQVPDLGDIPLPPLEAGSVTQLLFHPDNGSGSLPALLDAVKAQSDAILLLGAAANPDTPAQGGTWFVRRAALISGDDVSFIGTCNEELGGELARVAKAMGRQPDLSFLVDFQAEVLTSFEMDESGPVKLGPIEQTAYDLYES